ncbi:unnamed protein product [Lactuca saligna]|uniref:Uncharacterized protein n=1 Tax=Lactuca saligna TaxID=75948 RepID=A0AA35Z3D2_LACSI|nr:unnamed protein product [Lactuca saligna]
MCCFSVTTSHHRKTTVEANPEKSCYHGKSAIHFSQTRLGATVARDEFRRRRNKAATIVQDNMKATGVGMMMVAAVWEGEVLGEGHSTHNGYCGCVALERPIADLVQPIVALDGPNTLVEGYGSHEIRK